MLPICRIWFLYTVLKLYNQTWDKNSMQSTYDMKNVHDKGTYYLHTNYAHASYSTITITVKLG